MGKCIFGVNGGVQPVLALRACHRKVDTPVSKVWEMEHTPLQNHPSVEELFNHVGMSPLTLFEHFDVPSFTDSFVFVSDP